MDAAFRLSNSTAPAALSVLKYIHMSSVNPAAVKAAGSTVAVAAASPPVSIALVRLSPVFVGEMSSSDELGRLVKGEGDTSDAWLGSAGALLQPSDQLAGGNEEEGYGHKLDAALALTMGGSSSSSRSPHRDSSDDEQEEGDEASARLLHLTSGSRRLSLRVPLCLARVCLFGLALRLGVAVVAVSASPAPCGVVVACLVMRAPWCAGLVAKLFAFRLARLLCAAVLLASTKRKVPPPKMSDSFRTPTKGRRKETRKH